MKRYKVVTEEPAIENIETSFEWGCRTWGVKQARTWVSELRSAILSLARFPERHPIAPENDEFAETIRQMIIGRYRVLFTIRGIKVHVLHVRGPFAETDTVESE